MEPIEVKNQPGSILILLLIILSYLNASNLIPLAIFGEVVFGGLLNLTNVTGVIITAVEMENKNEK